jgi:hypothetical protein
MAVAESEREPEAHQRGTTRRRERRGYRKRYVR